MWRGGIAHEGIDWMLMVIFLGEQGCSHYYLSGRINCGGNGDIKRKG